MNKLVNLKIQYCKWGGSSRGARKLLTEKYNLIEQFKEKNPNIDVTIEHKGNKHPHVFGEYADGKTLHFCVKNENCMEVYQKIERLRKRTSRNRSLGNFKDVHVTRKPSIQGVWNPDLWLVQD
eukprot:TRINITY_DN10909_c0_g1_i1.p1 TRINITY_DN10909_c0_g1~~TRINITY_DN10909_c0_g1_i1.p1  ORF type:complete len:123 (-),score=30.75 TRINITY_DN10909_c0_g1_i1:43-411(-)